MTIVTEVDGLNVYSSSVSNEGAGSEELPISKGGEHSYANTQVSHLICNIRKGACTPKEVVR